VEKEVGFRHGVGWNNATGRKLVRKVGIYVPIFEMEICKWFFENYMFDIISIFFK